VNGVTSCYQGVFINSVKNVEKRRCSSDVQHGCVVNLKKSYLILVFIENTYI